MAKQYEIRARFDKETIVVYQAYPASIATSAIEHQRFVSPFSFHRMTWIKPSFLWLMHRSNWGRKNGQQRILEVHITRAGWDKALSLGVLTHPEPSIFPDPVVWQQEFDNAQIHVQWDAERSLRGAALNHYSIQVGISRHLIREFVDEWIVKIEDATAVVAKIRGFLKNGKLKNAKRLLPLERVYPVEQRIARRLLIE